MIKPITFNKMKSMFIGFILTLPLLTFAQWEQQAVGTNSTLSGLQFFDDEQGFVCGGNSIFSTLDGGDNWTLSHGEVSSVFIEDIALFDGNKAVAVSYDFDTNNSFLLRTIDGGISWDSIGLGLPNYLNTVFFVNENLGFCAGDGGLVLRTQDAGLTWQEQDSGTGQSLLSIHFINENVGVVVGGNPITALVLKTTDGGTTWNEMATPSSNFLQSVYLINDQTGVAVGWNGEILKTQDCGTTWEQQTSVEMYGNLEVHFLDNQTGYIVGGLSTIAQILKTTNQGQTWDNISPAIEAGLSTIDFPSTDIGYASGWNGTILKTTSGGTSAIANLPFEISVNTYPNPIIDKLTIDISNNNLISQITVFDNQAKKLNTSIINASQARLNFENYKTGFYFLLIETNTGKVVRKVVKN